MKTFDEIRSAEMTNEERARGILLKYLQRMDSLCPLMGNPNSEMFRLEKEIAKALSEASDMKGPFVPVEYLQKKLDEKDATIEKLKKALEEIHSHIEDADWRREHARQALKELEK